MFSYILNKFEENGNTVVDVFEESMECAGNIEMNDSGEKGSYIQNAINIKITLMWHPHYAHAQ